MFGNEHFHVDDIGGVCVVFIHSAELAFARNKRRMSKRNRPEVRRTNMRMPYLRYLAF
jgi:hypothetical protein